MIEVTAKKIIANPAIRILLKPNNFIATRDLTFRIIFEALLIWLVYHFIQDREYIIGSLIFYTLAFWHSFWGYAGIGHELMHGRVFSSKYVNKALYYLSSSFTWSNPSFFKESHLHHHAKTFSKYDHESNGVQKWDMISLFFYTTIDIPSMLRRLFYTIINSFGRKYVKGKWLVISGEHQFASIFILFSQTLFGLLIYYFTLDFLFVVLWILLPFTGQLINKLLAQSQHMGLESLRDFGPLNYSRSLKLPKLIVFLYAGMNYHAEHHLIPSIPYYNLGKASVLLCEFYNHKIIDWRHFYCKDFISFLRAKKSKYTHNCNT
jgi:fatty acid desaturase